MKNVALYNLGCKVNSYEMEVMRQSLQERGYQIVPFDGTADIYIVNTCTVTNIADRKSRQILHRAKQLNPRGVVVAVGCYVQAGDRTARRDECIDLAIGNNRKKDIADLLEAFLEDRNRNSAVIDINGSCGYEETQLKSSMEHTRAYIKIQDGCNQFCSYCAIPYVRGRVRSRRPEDILREIRGLAAAGYREVVLTGIHISSYGIDFAGGRDAGCSENESYSGYEGSSGLVRLAEQIQEIPGLERIRLGSLEPRIMTPENVRRLAEIPRLCPHFHLSLQSGWGTVFKKKNRHYTAGEYYSCVERLRQFFREPAITTDVIVGFPGETEEEFLRTKAFLEKVCFYEMHVFKYSRRAGTAADKMPGQVPEQTKIHRSAELLELTARQAKLFRGRYIGQEAEVLLEETREMGNRILRVGHTGDYVKIAVDVTNEAEGERTMPVNSLVKVPVKEFLTDEILI